MPHAGLRRPAWQTLVAGSMVSGRGQRPRLQLPIRTIPPEHLLELCDVISEKVVEENSLFPIHHPLVWHNISIFAAHRTQRLEAEKRKNGSERFALFVLELFKLHDLDLLAGEEFEETLELLGVESSIDVSKTARFSWRRGGDARFIFSHGIEEI